MPAISRWVRGRMFAAGAGVLVASTVAAVAGDGAWKERSQLVWDAAAGKLARQTVRAWDANPALDLDFIWEPAGAPAAGTIEGRGRLVWLAKGAATYDHAALYSEYEGEIRDGRPEGRGKIRLKSGLVYDGTWRDGVMTGYGVLRFATGDRYNGAVRDGTPEGLGRYAAVDGTIFEGLFVAGRREGEGTLTLPDARKFHSVWKDGVEIERRGLDGGPVQLAQAAGVTVGAYVDTRLNDAFIDADPDMLSYGYTAEPVNGEVLVTLDAPRILDLWKGGRTLRDDTEEQSAWMFEDPGQFAPVFLVVEIGNDTGRTQQVTSAWFDLAESITDTQPYVVVYGSHDTVFNPTFAFQNFGWGAALDATLTYAFGTEDGPVTQDFVADLGTIDSYLDVTTIDGMVALGVDAETLSDWESLECKGFDRDGRCTIAPGDYDELLGDLAPATFISNNYLMTRVIGELAYDWIDGRGERRARVSPVSVDMPLVYLGSRAEGGAPGPVERGYPTIAIPLDEANIRVPIPFTAELAPGESRRFAVNLTAEKSSYSRFRFLFELADGEMVSSPVIDLSYFTPRLNALN